MNSNALSRDKLRDLTTDDTFLGTDADGTEHYWDGTSRTAWVVDDGDVVFAQCIGDLSDYVAHVRRVAGGWGELRYDDGDMGELLADLSTDEVPA